MSLITRFLNFLGRLKNRRQFEYTDDILREFVYLDEVSVYSILASRKDGIATQFSESQTASLNSEIGTSLGAGFGGSSAKLNAKVNSEQIHSSQVVRKAIIQTSFKELYEIEQSHLAFRCPNSECIPKITTLADIGRKLEVLTKEEWIVDPNELQRGRLFEVEVELKADPIFHMMAVITLLSDLLEENDLLLDSKNTSQLAEMHSMARVLESLLAGLVPVQGRLVDYKTATIGDQELLIHNSLLEQLSQDPEADTYDSFVVGVTQQDLFWKDIRRVLFSEARHTVFCRLAASGLKDSWQPVKVANVLTGIIPNFDRDIGNFSEITRQAMTATNPSNSQSNQLPEGNPEATVLKCYANLLAQHHKTTLEPEVVNEMITGSVPDKDWMKSVDSLRPIFSELTQRIEDKLDVKTPCEVTYDLRQRAKEVASSNGTAPTQTPNGFKVEQGLENPPGKFLDAEFVAIYW